MQQKQSMDAVGRPRIEFFRVLHPEFLKKLRLPFAFVLRSGLKPGMATIRTQLGVWQVNLEGEGDDRSSIHFGAGWPEFSKDHNLHVGNFMVFTYQGNMIFDAKIFDTTCCNAVYAGEQQNDADEQDTRGQGSGDASKNSNPKAKGSNVAPQVTQSTSVQEPRDARPDDVPAAAAAAAAGAVVVPQFEKIMTMDRRVVIPYGFCSFNGLLNASEITIKDELNQEWKVNFWSKPLKCRLGKGFRRFVEDKGIKVGDKCVFRLVSERTLQVQIIKAQQPLPLAKRRKLLCHHHA